MPQIRGLRFTELGKKIKELMKKYEKYTKCYAKIAEEINNQYNSKYTSKQIRQWCKNELDPKLCHEPLGENQKSFINNWVKKYDDKNHHYSNQKPKTGNEQQNNVSLPEDEIPPNAGRLETPSCLRMDIDGEIIKELNQNQHPEILPSFNGLGHISLNKDFLNHITNELNELKAKSEVRMVNNRAISSDYSNKAAQITASSYDSNEATSQITVSSHESNEAAQVTVPSGHMDQITASSSPSHRRTTFPNYYTRISSILN
ncbi:hypothetical protein C1645_881476 [Glomus cerebriforme]|uniref:Uncharacterized protein n=1 Tax=Glomus cerebriforme TaxID=658196 RepID=A0A397SCC4_9GLOM|nr:hypothetical protein C1645_881476 [Glomus cerebriforme]